MEASVNGELLRVYDLIRRLQNDVTNLAKEFYETSAISYDEISGTPETLSSFENDMNYISSEEVDQKIESIPPIDDSNYLKKKDEDPQECTVLTHFKDITATTQKKDDCSDNVATTQFVHSLIEESSKSTEKYISGIYSRLDAVSSAQMKEAIKKALKDYYDSGEVDSKIELIISELYIPTKTSDLRNDSGFITIDDIPLSPVTSVNGLTGDVTIQIPTVPTNISSFTNDVGYITDPGVTSVNNQTGAVYVQENVQANWNSATGLSAILNKPALKRVATTGSYNDLDDTPDLSNYVDLTSNQSISGVKRFLDTTYIEDDFNVSGTSRFYNDVKIGNENSIAGGASLNIYGGSLNTHGGEIDTDGASFRCGPVDCGTINGSSANLSDVTATSLSVSGTTTLGAKVDVRGTLDASGQSIKCGDITVNGTTRTYGDLVTYSVKPYETNKYSLGNSSKYYKSAYIKDNISDNVIVHNLLTLDNNDESVWITGNYDSSDMYLNFTDSYNGNLVKLPFDKDGIIALTDDIPTKTSDLTNDSDFVKKVLATKSYSNIIGTANNFDGAGFFFATVVPTGWKDFWYIKYRIHAHMLGRSANDGEEWSEVEMCGSATNVYWSKIRNATQNTSVRPYYYHYLYRLTETGFNSDYGHLIGVSLQSSYSPTNASYKRDFTIELLEADNCTFTFMDNMSLYSNVTGSGSTNYTGASSYDGYTQGVTLTGDRNTTTNFSLSGGCWITAGTNGIFAYTIIMADSSGTYQSVVLSRTTGTTKSKNPVGFDLTKPIYWYWSSTDITSGNHTTAGLNAGYPGDIRYSCNCGSTLIQGKPFYLVMTLGNDGLFYLDTVWWTLTLPSTNDNKYYVYIGIAYSTYSVHMEVEKPIYYHDGTKLRRYIPGVITSSSSATQIMMVNISPDYNDGYVADHTFAEIKAFLDNGGTVIAYDDADGDSYYYLDNYIASEVVFTRNIWGIGGFATRYYTIDNTNTVSFIDASHSISSSVNSSSTTDLANSAAVKALYDAMPEIKSISVNNAELLIDQDGNVDIAVPDLLSDLLEDNTHRTVTDTEKASWNAKSTFSGDYNDLTNKPTIPSAVTESTVSGWGFTKNTGTYSKPSGGIPKTDLASAVQTSLGKADTALQSYTETDPVFTASVAHGITQTDISNWNSKSNFSGSYNDLTDKPTIPTVPTNVSAFTNDAGYLTGFTESDPTVPAWAKAASKPTYTASEVGALPSNTPLFSGNYNDLTNKPSIPTVPTNVSAFTNDAGYLTSFTESDPTVPSWAKAANKPTYTAAEVGALPDTTVIPTIPTNVSAFTNDAGYITSASVVTIYSGSATPSSSLGSNGDIYIKTS